VRRGAEVRRFWELAGCGPGVAISVAAIEADVVALGGLDGLRWLAAAALSFARCLRFGSAFFARSPRRFLIDAIQPGRIRSGSFALTSPQRGNDTEPSSSSARRNGRSLVLPLQKHPT
jgi:hypothetical protein